jgi:hypothetical protein
MSLPKLTPTEQRIYLRLLEGPAPPVELVLCLSDEYASLPNLRCHLRNMRRKGIRVAPGYSGLYSIDSTSVFDSTSAVG